MRLSFASLVTWLLGAFSPVLLVGQNFGASLNGRVDGKTYVSPNSIFSITMPVDPDAGGTVSDTENVVTFQNALGTHASIACFKMDASQRWENETRGRKDYLAWFFSNFVQADFQRRFPGAKIESARFMPAVMDGALMVSNLLPGGSMFEEKIAINLPKDPAVAKRGNLLFVRNEHIFVISVELAERVLNRSTYKTSTQDEDEVLRARLISLLAQISFSDQTGK